MKKKILALTIVITTLIIGGCASHAPPPPCDRYATSFNTSGYAYAGDCGRPQPINRF